MLMMKNEPSTKAPINVCVSRFRVDGFRTAVQKSTSSARKTVIPSTIHGCPSRSTAVTRWPAGVCCQLFATTIQMEEKIEPSETMIVATKWNRVVTRSQPNTSTARKPDSRKNAKIPSAAKADPNTSPTKRE